MIIRSPDPPGTLRDDHLNTPSDQPFDGEKAHDIPATTTGSPQDPPPPPPPPPHPHPTKEWPPPRHTTPQHHKPANPRTPHRHQGAATSQTHHTPAPQTGKPQAPSPTPRGCAVFRAPQRRDAAETCPAHV